jgi:hypothetical protein
VATLSTTFGFFLQRAYVSTGWFGRSVDAVLEEQRANFGEMKSTLELLAASAPGSEEAARLTQRMAELVQAQERVANRIASSLQPGADRASESAPPISAAALATRTSAPQPEPAPAAASAPPAPQAPRPADPSASTAAPGDAALQEEIARLTAEIARLRDEALATRGSTTGADLWLERGGTAAVHDRAHVLGVVNDSFADGNQVGVNMSGATRTMNPGDALSFSVEGGACMVIYKGREHPTERGTQRRVRYGFDIVHTPTPRTQP